ncbi:TetR/AcrR family transcriptional regulator [Rhizobium sp. NZLR1]|uniref:TetR/AcrR family transcriptional regulator n=1 Tax=Rhizobium sp. NZLR1 TaxID=2731096 RepID=UPI001A983B0F|nr:TetR/AcrR family transcriptional regulator [Rhizobium sp. NZLR1]MBX5204684.1 TetR/AcrR family transcriptional regulator [Rhizobium sp. NZLR1]QSZ23399.1 TetR/AcrR family transcriptional regulator [Rhizobium sp. NZLR1]
MTDAKPKWNRRKDARPSEIVDAAMALFAENGFANTKLDDVARRAGVAKGTLYRYFDTKEALFRAVVQHLLTNHLEVVEKAGKAFEGSLAEFVPMLLKRAAQSLGDDRLPGLARVMLAEGRAFPDLAAVWHDELAARMLDLIAGMVAKAQDRGEVRPGDPRLYAFSIIGPISVALLYHEAFGSRADAPDLEALASQHAETILRGMAASIPYQKEPTP